MRKALFRAAFALLASLALASAPAEAVVLHVDTDAPLPADRPNDAVVGKWRSLGSTVAVGKAGWGTTNYAIGVRHLWAAVGEHVTFAGTEYTIAQMWDNATADIRVVRLETATGGNAQLPNYVQCYTATDEVSQSNFVIGGYGMVRDQNLYTGGGTLYGYSWKWPAGGPTENWGANTIDSTGSHTNGSMVSDVLVGDFDAPSTHNAAMGDGDSGGGWFIKPTGGSTWYVAGVSAYAEHAANLQSWFKNSANGNPDPDWIKAVRVSSYATWINGIIQAPTTGDLRIKKFFDCNQNGQKDYVDDNLLPNWQYTVTGPGGFNQVVTTDANGEILLTSLAAGQYTVTETVKKDFSVTTGSNPAIVTVLAGGTVETMFGNFLAGDINQDGIVDTIDFTILKANFGQSPKTWIQGNLNPTEDTAVDSIDFTILKANFGKGSVGAAGGGAVPEPATMLLLLAAAPLLGRTRRGCR